MIHESNIFGKHIESALGTRKFLRLYIISIFGGGLFYIIFRFFSLNDLFCKHRVGKVPTGEASLHISIWSPHRKEALNALEWFITELKKNVPIWKWAIYEDGTREAT